MPTCSRRVTLGILLSGLLREEAMANGSLDYWDEACRVLEEVTRKGLVRGAAMLARVGKQSRSQAFGTASHVDKSFLLGSISKPISIAAFMTLFDRGKFELDEPIVKYLPEFRGEGREKVLIQHLMTHVSGLPDQLPDNARLRSSHSTLDKFVAGAVKVPLKFEPGTKYEYSSMAIMLCAEIAQRISGIEFRQFVDQSVFQPLGMSHSAMGMGKLANEDVMPCQVEFGAVEAGGGSAESKTWDWNSDYWRHLGAPWGGAHASVGDIAKLLEEFLHPTKKLYQNPTGNLMISNHNPTAFPSRGFGFDVGLTEFCAPCTQSTFGHTGSTGTIAWADPIRDRLCVVLTTLPATAVTPHPRQLASDWISKAD